MRDRLIGLIMNAPKLPITIGGRAQGKTYQTAGNIADHLLANGVIVPPVRVGGNMYTLNRGRVKEWKVCFCGLNSQGELKFHLADEGFKTLIEVWDFGIGKTVFLTREEAEQALLRESE